MEIRTSLFPVELKDEDLPTYLKKSNTQRSYDCEFDYQIRKRGEEYYNNNRVQSCFKTQDEYVAVVEGNGRDYTVTIFDDEGFLDMDCSCPCNFNCKHEYAVLLAIDDGSYIEFELKDEIPKQELILQEVISKIPADKLKEYLMNKGGDAVVFDINAFEHEFFDYLPKQLKDYYYNTLYNTYISRVEFTDLLNKYIVAAKRYVEKERYDEAFDIIESIIKVYVDLEIEDVYNELPNIYPSIGMYMRIVYRKCDSKLKNKINKWIKEFESKKYYNNIYLEDIILTIK